MEHFTPSEAPIHETQRLPVIPPRRIVGRNRDLGQTFAQMRVGAAVLLHGPGGGGKSALAATIATAFTTFKGGVLWWPVDNDPLEQLIARLGRAYGDYRIGDAARPLDYLDAAAGLLERGHHPLIVLDGALDLDVAREFVRRVASGSPLILTGREGGNGPWTPLEIGGLGDDDGVALFMATAGLETVSPLARADIQGVCSALGGLPLAIVLAARHVRAQGIAPGEFLGMLATSPTSDLPGLAAIFHQLPEALQGMILTIGATFGGRATTILLEYAHLAPGETVVHVMDMLGARGLAQRVPAQGPVSTYLIHEAIHQFARQWLTESGRLEPVLNRVRDGILAYAEQYGRDAREARAYLVDEMTNVLGLGEDAARRGDIDTLERISHALKAAFADGGYGYEIHHLDDLGEAMLESGSAPVEQMPLFESGVPRAAPPVAAPATPPLPEVPPASYDTAHLRPLAADRPVPDAYAAPSVPAFSLEAEPVAEPDLMDLLPDEGQVLDGVPMDYSLVAEPELAESLTGGLEEVAEEEAAPVEPPPPELPPAEPVAPFEAMPPAPAALPGDEGDVDALYAAAEQTLDAQEYAQAAPILLRLGRALLRQGRLGEAREALQQALEVYEYLREPDGMLSSLEALADLTLEEGDLEQAITYATRAENLAAEHEVPDRHGHLLALLGDIRLELGETESATATYQEAIGVLQESGDALRLGIVQTKLGSAYLDTGNYPGAIDMLGGALENFRRTGRVDFQGRVLGNLGLAYGQLGLWQEAEQHHQQALAIARQSGDSEEEERQLANLAYTAQGRGDRDGLLAYYRQALDLAYRTAEVVWQVRYLDVLGRLLMDDAPQVALAVRLLEEANTLIPDEERPRWLRRAQTRLERLQASGTRQAAVPDDLARWAAGG